MPTQPSTLARVGFAYLLVVIGTFLQSCSFHPQGDSVCVQYSNIPVTPLTAQASQTVFETSGTVIAIHGTGSGKYDPNNSVNHANEAGAIKVRQSVQIPPYADQAAVILNGWHLAYAGGDRHMLAVGNAITEIHVDPKRHSVTWDALGILRDDNSEAYNWTYDFTVVAWNDVNLNAFVDQGTIDGSNLNCSTTNTELTDNYFYSINSGTKSALSCFFSFLHNPGFGESKSIAVLPRGFGFGWNDGDHNLYQLAYNMDHGETIAQTLSQKYNKQAQLVAAPLPNPPTAHVGSGFVSWSPYAVLQDNADRRDYTFGELVSGLGGNDVGIIQPPYAILPGNPDVPFLGVFSGCPGEIGEDQPVSQNLTIENIPYQFAVPMLSGWQLSYSCNDAHIKDLGVWIDSWSYQPPANGNGGILSYKLMSVMRDNDDTHQFNISHKISVLGLRPVTLGGAVKPKVVAPITTPNGKRQ